MRSLPGEAWSVTRPSQGAGRASYDVFTKCFIGEKGRVVIQCSESVCPEGTQREVEFGRRRSSKLRVCLREHDHEPTSVFS